jgi:hypothetical protein
MADIFDQINTSSIPAANTSAPNSVNQKSNDIFDTSYVPKATTPTPQSTIKTLPSFLGGGAYNSVLGQPNTLVNTGHTTYGGFSTNKGQERDDIVPVGLGGANSSPQNIRMENTNNTNQPYSTANQTPTDPIEVKAINDYKSGKLTLPQARLLVLSAKQKQESEANGVSTNVLVNLFPGANQAWKDTNLKQTNVNWDKKEGIFAGAPEVVSGAISDEEQRIKDAFSTDINEPANSSKVLGKSLSAFVGLGNVAFSPISALFTAAKNVPVLSQISGLVNSGFSLIGDVGKNITQAAVNSLPIKQSIKDNLNDAVGEIGALAAQIIVGGKAGGKAKILDEARTNLAPKFGEDGAATIIDEAQKSATNISNDPKKAIQFETNNGADLKSGINTFDPRISYKTGKDLGVNADGEKTLARTEIDPITKESTISIDKSANSGDIKEILDNEHAKIIADRLNEAKSLIPETPKSLIQSKVDNYIDKSGLTKEDISAKIKSEIGKVGGYENAVNMVQNSPDLAKTKIPTLTDIMTSNDKINTVTNTTHSSLINDGVNRISNELKYEPVKQSQIEQTAGEPIKYEKTGVSGVAKQLEASAIEKGYIKDGYDELAPHEGTTFKEQASVMADHFNKDNENLDKTRSILRGESPLPDKAKSAGFLAAVQSWMDSHPGSPLNPNLQYEMANSPLTTDISSAASNVSIARMMEHDSPIKTIEEIKKAKSEGINKKGGEKKVNAKDKSEVENVVKKSRPTKETLSSFLESIRCK